MSSERGKTVHCTVGHCPLSSAPRLWSLLRALRCVQSAGAWVCMLSHQAGTWAAVGLRQSPH